MGAKLGGFVKVHKKFAKWLNYFYITFIFLSYIC